MYFDRILFSALFATLLGTAVLALVPAITPASLPAGATIVAEPAAQTLERVVIIGKREDARI